MSFPFFQEIAKASCEKKNLRLNRDVGWANELALFYSLSSSLESAINFNKAVYTAAPVAGGWAGAVMGWAGAVISWAGASRAVRILKVKA